MADVEQTKWSSSYSLKYSHDTTYKYNKQVFMIVLKYFAI
jgi:hypothetical protein